VILHRDAAAGNHAREKLFVRTKPQWKALTSAVTELHARSFLRRRRTRGISRICFLAQLILDSSAGLRSKQGGLALPYSKFR